MRYVFICFSMDPPWVTQGKKGARIVGAVLANHWSQSLEQSLVVTRKRFCVLTVQGLLSLFCYRKAQLASCIVQSYNLANPAHANIHPWSGFNWAQTSSSSIGHWRSLSQRNAPPTTGSIHGDVVHSSALRVLRKCVFVGHWSTAQHPFRWQTLALFLSELLTESGQHFFLSLVSCYTNRFHTIYSDCLTLSTEDDIFPNS